MHNQLDAALGETDMSYSTWYWMADLRNTVNLSRQHGIQLLFIRTFRPSAMNHHVIFRNIAPSGELEYLCQRLV